MQSLRLSVFLALGASLCAGPVAASDTAPAVEAQAVAAAHGVVVSADDGAPLAGVTVTVGEQSARTDSRGRYRIEVPASPLYTVRVSGAGHYPADHAFARHELAVEAGTLRIPPVQLVERRADRQLFVFGGDVMGGRRYETPLEGERRLVHDDNRREDMRALLDVMAPT